MFDEKELGVIRQSLDVAKRSIDFLENFGIEGDEFRIGIKRTMRKCEELLKEANANAKLKSGEVKG